MCRINPAKSIIKKLIFLDNLNVDYTISNATTNIRIREKWNYEIDDNALSEEFNGSEIMNVTLNASAYLNDFIEANEVESESSESESDNDPLDFTYYP
uniref:Uncharacterized protein n=1 Tax=Strongyloides papillosus TaxID=174720 RepID=A0A0N5CC64_STREA